MNLGLESISGNLSALPGTGPAGQPGSGPGASGGFASTLAAAQGESSPTILPANAASSSTATAPEERGSGSTTGSRAGNSWSRRALPNLPLRKPASNPAPGPVPVTANPVALPVAVTQLSALPTVMEGASLPTGGWSGGNGAGLPGGVIPPEPPAVGNGFPANPAGGPSVGQQYSPPGGPSAGPQFSAVSEPEGFLSALAAKPLSTSTSAATGVLPQNVLPPVPAAVQSSERKSSAAVLPTNLGTDSGALASGAMQSGPANSFKTELIAAEPTVLSANTQPSELSFTSEPAAPDTAWNAMAEIQGTRVQTNSATLGAAQAAVPISGIASAPTPAAANLPAAPVLLANAFPMAGPAAGPQELGSGNLPAAPENSLPAVTANPAPANNSGGPAEIGDILSAAASAPTAATTAWSSPVPPLGQTLLGQTLPGQTVPGQTGLGQTGLGQTLPRPAAAKVSAGGAVPANVRGAGASSPATSASANETEAGNASPMASQSPFSVYFSTPGPGTEAAAAALPKMILPAGSAASRASSTAGSAAPAANSPAAGLQSNAIPPVAALALVPQPNTNKDLPAGSAGWSAPAAALHADATGAAPSAAVTVAQAGAVVPAAALASAPASVVAATPPPPGLPAGAGGAVTTLPPAPPAPAAAVPAPGPVQMAQMIDRVGQAEMRVGMNTSAFGNVEVRTVVHASDVGLTIGSEKGDLRGLLANDMTAISNSLQQQNLRLNNVSFMQGYASANPGGGGGDSQPQRSWVPAAASAGFSSPEAMPEEAFEAVAMGGWVGGGSGLSILA